MMRLISKKTIAYSARLFYLAYYTKP